MKLTTNLYLILKLRMCGVIPPMGTLASVANKGLLLSPQQLHQFHFLTAVPETLLSKLPFDYHISQNSVVQNVALQPCMWGGPGSYLSSEKDYCLMFHDIILSLKP